MNSVKTLDEPPSYETIQPKNISNFSDRIKAVQTQRVDELIATVVDPFLEHQALNGLSHAILVVTPADVHQLQSGFSHFSLTAIEKQPLTNEASSDETVILGFPDHAYVRLFRFQDPKDTSSFWSDCQVVKKVREQIEDRLRVPAPSETPIKTVDRPPRELQSTRSSSFWKRKSKSERQCEAIERVKAPESPQQKTVIKVSNEEVSIRVKMPMDLWEVRNGFALVVRVSV